MFDQQFFNLNVVSFVVCWNVLEAPSSTNSVDPDQLCLPLYVQVVQLVEH